MEKQDANNGLHLKVLSDDPEIRAHIYQQIMEFQPFITPTTLVEVIALDCDDDADDPTSTEDSISNARSGEWRAPDVEASEKKEDFLERVRIRLTEGESKLEAEGVGETIFIAISEAKKSLLRELILIQDEVVSTTERHQMINSILSNQQSH